MEMNICGEVIVWKLFQDEKNVWIEYSLLVSPTLIWYDLGGCLGALELFQPQMRLFKMINIENNSYIHLSSFRNCSYRVIQHNHNWLQEITTILNKVTSIKWNSAAHNKNNISREKHNTSSVLYITRHQASDRVTVSDQQGEKESFAD